MIGNTTASGTKSEGGTALTSKNLQLSGGNITGNLGVWVVHQQLNVKCSLLIGANYTNAENGIDDNKAPLPEKVVAVQVP